MIMCDSSFEIERVNSEEEKVFENVPRDMTFMLKFKDSNNKTYRVLDYKLKKGKTLPYNVMLRDKSVHFDKSLKPSIDEMVLLSVEKDNWFVFKDKEGRESGHREDVVPVEAGLAVVPDQVETDQVFEMLESSALAKMELAIKSNKNKQSVVPYKCLFCQNRQLSVDRVVSHIKDVHPDWERSYDIGSRGLTSSDLNSSLPLNTPQDEDSLPPQDLNSSLPLHLDNFLPLDENTNLAADQDRGHNTINVLNNPNWFLDMRTYFKEAVVSGLSKRTRDAFADNENVEEAGLRRKIMSEILGGAVTYLEGIFGSDTPKQKHTRQVAELLASQYPAMFQVSASDGLVPTYSGYGLGGLKGLKNLPERICNLYRDRKPMRKAKRARTGVDAVAEEEPVIKKGRNKQVYGVNNTKFYAVDNSKESLPALKLAGAMGGFDEREEIFKKHRPALMKLIRESSKNISKVCNGLFKDPKHLEELFVDLTDVKISTKMERGFVGHMGNMEEYLVSVVDTLEFSEKMLKVKEDCDLLFKGSQVHKFVHLLREAGDHFDGDGSSFMRTESDGNPKDSSPHIFARKLDDSYVFELWCERECIMGNMGLTSSICALLHLAFSFNLKYPQRSETVCDFLQRVVADYGNDEGTKTHKSRKTAETKLTKYQIQLGKVLGAKNAV